MPFLSISGSDFIEMFVGVGASRVRDLFSQVQIMYVCIVHIFICMFTQVRYINLCMYLHAYAGEWATTYTYTICIYIIHTYTHIYT